MMDEYSEQITAGGKVSGCGFLIFMLMGSALDSPDYRVPLLGIAVGVALMAVGQIISKAEGRKHVQSM